MKKMKLILTLLFFIGQLSLVYSQNWELDFDNALKAAQDSNKTIVLVFSGSDWCAPCMKLEKEIWKSDTFQNYAEDHFVMVRADFPRRKVNKLSKEQEEKNAKLAEKYNPQGYFPLVVVMDENTEILGKTGYKKMSPEAYIQHLNRFIPNSAQQVFHKTTPLMGSRFDITVVAMDANEGDKYIDTAIEEIKRIEKLISSWDSNSQTSKINRNAGIQPVKVDKELFDLISRSIAISSITDGAFDISYASIGKIWKFDGSMTQMPTEQEIQNSVEKVGYEKIILDSVNHTVFLPQKGMKIGFGAVGKGYAADKTKKLLMEMGVTAGIINASGDMNTWGKQPDGTEWTVAITNPMNKNNAFATLPLKQGAVVTSGDYEKYIEFDSIRYTHIINPKTGYPSQGIISVTVFASSAELADALATSIFVMGIEVGLDRVNQLPNVECIIIDTEGSIYQSQNIKINEKTN